VGGEAAAGLPEANAGPGVPRSPRRGAPADQGLSSDGRSGYVAARTYFVNLLYELNPDDGYLMVYSS